MAIATDATGNRTTGTGTTVTLSHTCTGSNLLLIVYVRTSKSDDTEIITGVTYNSVAMTQAVKQQDSSAPAGGRAWNYMYYLINPATGAHNIVASFGADNTAGKAIDSSSYTGCSQTSQPDAFNSLSENVGSGNHTVSVTVVAANCWLVESVYCWDAVPDSVVNGVLRTDTLNEGMADSNGTVGTGAQTIGYHWAASDRHAILAMSIAPVVVATANTNFLAFM